MSQHTSLRVSALLALIALFVVGYAGWRAVTSAEREPSRAEPQQREQVALESRAEAAIEERATPEISEPTRIEAPAPEVTETSDEVETLLRVVVLDPELVPVPGAKIEVWRDEEADEFTFLEENRRRSLEADGESDAEGSCAFQVQPGQPFVVEALADGFARARETHCYAGELARIRLSYPAAVRGFVDRAADGAPVAGAEVRLRAEYRSGAFDRRVLVAHTDSVGSYAIEGLRAGSYTLQVLPRRSAASGTLRFELAAGETLQKDITVEAGIVVTGRVTDAPTKRPIANATIGEGWSYARSVRTDSNGAFRFEGVSPRTSALQAKAVGYGETEKHLPREAEESGELRLDFELLPGHRARGRVVDRAGEPIAEAYVAAVGSENRDPYREQHTDWRSVLTGADGRFDIKGVRPDLAHTLLVRRAGYGTVVYEFPADEAERTVVDLGDIVLARGLLLHGVVVDDSDRPVPNLPLSLHGSNADRGRLSAGRATPWGLDSYVAEREAGTDDEGRFGFGDLAAGTYTLIARLPDHARRQSLEATLADDVGDVEVRFVLQRGLAITGHISAIDGSELSEVCILALADEGDSGGRAYVKGGGPFSIGGLESGTYTVTAEITEEGPPPEANFADARLTSIPAGTEGLVIQLEREVPLTGVVLDALGEPAAGAFVEARTSEGAYLTYVTADDEGRFTIQVPPGAPVDLTAVPPSPTEELKRWDSEVFGHVHGVSPGSAPGSLTIRLAWSP